MIPMRFLDNKTDRLVTRYLEKSLNLRKSEGGKIPIKKLVVEPDKKPYFQTFYVNPKDVKHLHLKHGDSVHQYEIPTHPTLPDTPHHVIINDTNFLDKKTQILGGFSTHFKDVLHSHINAQTENLIYTIQDMYRFRKTFNKPQNQHVPQVLRITPHLEKIDTEKETFTVSWTTNIPYTEVDKDLYHHISMGLTGNGLFDQYSKGSWGKTEDGYLTFTSTEPQSMYNLLKDEKKQLHQDLIQDIRRQLTNINEEDLKEISTGCITEREKERFSEILEHSSKENIASFRTTGICANPNDEQAIEYIKTMHKAYLTSERIFQEKTFDEGLYTFKELRNIFNTYIEQYNKLTSKRTAVENAEIKSSIASVSKETYEDITKLVLSNWDNYRHKKFSPKIRGIYEVTDIPVREEFEKLVEKNKGYSNPDEDPEGKDCQLDTFYHGTDYTATSLIVGKSGAFKIGKAKAGRMLGDGVYLALQSSKSAQYIGDKFGREKGTKGTLMVVEASLGECAYIDDDDTYNKFFPEDDDDYDDDYDPDNYDTIVALPSCVLNTEYCVHNTKAVCPKYLIDMELERND